MAGEQLPPIIIDILANNKASKEFARVRSNAKNVLTSFQKIDGYNVKVMESYNKAGKKIGETMQVVGKAQKSFNDMIGRGLSLMFGFMQLSRMTNTVIRSIITNFKKLTEDGLNPVRQAMTRFEANIRFLGFALMDAAGPMIIAFLDQLGALALSLAKADPEKLKDIAIGLGAMAAVFATGMFAAQMELFVKNGIVPLVKAVKEFDSNKFKQMKDTMAAWTVPGTGGGQLGTFVAPIPKGIMGPTGASLAVVLAGMFEEELDSLLDRLENTGKIDSFWTSFARIFIDAAKVFTNLVTMGVKSVFDLAKNYLQERLDALSQILSFFSIDLDLRLPGLRDAVDFMEELGEVTKIAAEEMVPLYVAYDRLHAKNLEKLNEEMSSYVELGNKIKAAPTTAEALDVASAGGELDLGLKETMDELELASLAMFTSAEDMKQLSTAITSDLVPAFSGEKGLNVPLNEAVGSMGGLNDTLKNNKTQLDNVIEPLSRDTDERFRNAESINAQADANLSLAESIIELARARAEAAEIAAEGAS